MKTAQVKWLGEEPNNNRQGHIAMHGPGTLEIDESGVRVIGKQGKKLIPVLVGSILGLVSLIAVIILIDSLGVRISGRGGGKLAFLMGLIGGILPGYGIYALLIAKLPGTPVDQRIPWDKLKVTRATHERIEIHASVPGFTGHFMFVAADPASKAVLAEAFGLPQALAS
jgi:hypothetical protein